MMRTVTFTLEEWGDSLMPLRDIKTIVEEAFGNCADVAAGNVKIVRR
jgi:hypothetical protein